MGGSLNKAIATVFGAVYLLIGVLGFFVTGDTGFASTEGGLLLGAFEVNGLHNVVHEQPRRSGLPARHDLRDHLREHGG